MEPAARQPANQEYRGRRTVDAHRKTPKSNGQKKLFNSPIPIITDW
jgi:hypothetical protein